MEKAPAEYLESAKEVFALTLDPLKDSDKTPYILDMTERIHASLNLCMYLIIRERKLLQEGKIDKAILTEASYLNETIRKKYFEGLAHTIQAGLSSLDEDTKQAIDSTQDETAKQGMLQSIEVKRNSITILQVLLSSVSSSL